MPVISLKIYNSVHNITCNEGDEEQLRSLATKFEKQVTDLAKHFPNSNDKTLYLIAALTLLDKLEEKEVSAKPKDDDNPMMLVTEIFEALTEKIELLTKKVEKL